MKRIQVLSKHTANQIAAGEVVERPASVVKELVENSIDAGSTAVTVEISGGGIEYIRVTDNGAGIIPEDLPTAFLSHATSKISTADDLAHIETLGFRGEALASIAAVSMLTMRTRIKGGEEGAMIRIEGGEVKEHGPSGCPEGSTTEVRNLFYNVPARLKFLKSQRAEAGAISDYISRAIMANPAISFKLISNGKPVYHSPGDGQLRSAIFCVYGGETLPHIRPVDYDDGKIKITGYIGTEKLARPNRQHQSLFVNSRYVRSTQISYGIQRAFDTRLMGGRFPFYALNIAVDFAEVDVNVHPNKMEVRFKDEQSAVRAATIAARMALGDPVAPMISHEEIAVKPKAAAVENRFRENDFVRTAEIRDEFRSSMAPKLNQPAPAAPAKLKEPTATYGPAEISNILPPDAFTYNMSVEQKRLEIKKEAEKPRPFIDVSIAPNRANKAEPVSPPPRQLDFGRIHYRIVGQLFGCYWVIQQDDEVFFIDQHAAHERRLYENIISKPMDPDSQLLMLPEIEKLTAMEYETLAENMELFGELGFEIEEFGPLTVSIRAVPSIFSAPEAPAFIHEAIGILQNKNSLTTVDIKRSSLIQSACKHAVKAGDMLSDLEIKTLLDEYSTSGVPLTCPHGRPVMVRMNKAEFEKLFKRVL
ncbi:MAG: DNA mismatch repair endonuclease MutL [Clostridia bacterium]|nr:DNA mismatch repair endonuclease MutL [Clostridia bacterium]